MRKIRKRIFSILVSIMLFAAVVGEITANNVYAEISEFNPSLHGGIIEHGNCGDTQLDIVQYDLYEDGMCHIYGEGKVADCFFAENMEIKEVFIDNMISDIGVGVLFMPTIGDGSGINNPFWGCGNLEKITVSQQNNVYDSREGCNAVIKKDGAVLVAACKSSVIPDGITVIGDGAFCDINSIKQVDIPDSVSVIKGYAFRGCSSLCNVNIPDSVTNIGSFAFANCGKLNNINIPSNIEVIDSLAFEKSDNVFIELARDSIIKPESFLSTNISFKVLEKDNNDNLVQDIINYYGDIDGDNNVELDDVTVCLNVALGIFVASDKLKMYGDIDGGGISLSDTTTFLKMALGIEDMKKTFDFPDNYKGQRRIFKRGDVTVLTEIEEEQGIKSLSEDMYKETPLYSSKDAQVYKVKDTRELSLAQKLTLRKMFDLSEEEFKDSYYYKANVLWSEKFGFDGLKMLFDFSGEKNLMKIELNTELQSEQESENTWCTMYFRIKKDFIGYEDINVDVIKNIGVVN